MSEYTVYVHISPNGKRYYGTTKLKVKKRWRRGNGYKNNKYFTEAIEKYGWDNFEHIIVAKGLPKDDAYWLEEELIKAWDTTNRDKGYNIEKGGKYGAKGLKRSEEAKKKMSESRPDISGENNPMYGKHHTEETRKKLSKANSGKHPSEEARKKMSKARIGKHHSEETKNKMKENNIGKSNPNAKAVICITTKRIFHTAKEGGEYYNCDYGTISKCCKGKYKSSGKYQGKKLVWRYIKWNHNKIYRINSNN